MFQTPGTATNQAAQEKSKPAPIGGINARDGYFGMGELDAVDLVNWIPDTGGLRCRKGYSEWAINFPASNPVEGFAAYFAPTTTFPGGAFLTAPTAMPGKFFAATQAAIYDITSATNAPAVSQALSNVANAGWISSIMLTNSAGSFLLVASETDGYFVYDGAAWNKVTLGAGANQVSVVDPTSFCHVAMWKRRAWFAIRNSSKAAYLAVDSLYGAAAAYDFGPLFKHGGKLEYIANWTIDAGEGIDDLLVVVGSNGDVLVFKGTDPSSITTFFLVGSWFVGQVPVGRRGYTQFGGDLIIIGSDGIFPISFVTRGGADFLVASAKEYSSFIRPLISVDLRASFTVRGWQMLIHPTERLMVVNVPDYGSVSKKQYVMGTSTMRWTRFANISAYSYGSIAGYAFAGTITGKVYLLYTGFYDNVAYGTSTGDGIQGVVQPAFSSFGSPALEKYFMMARASFISAATPSVLIDMSVNYKLKTPSGSTPTVPNSGALWNNALWNSGVWGGELLAFSEWKTVGGIGHVGAASLKTTCVGDTILAQIDYIFQSGGPF